ncbi:hypothetical protein L9F63_002355, partial [Diploptera punctata]
CGVRLISLRLRSSFTARQRFYQIIHGERLTLASYMPYLYKLMISFMGLFRELNN